MCSPQCVGRSCRADDLPPCLRPAQREQPGLEPGSRLAPWLRKQVHQSGGSYVPTAPETSAACSASGSNLTFLVAAESRTSAHTTSARPLSTRNDRGPISRPVPSLPAFAPLSCSCGDWQDLLFPRETISRPRFNPVSSFPRLGSHRPGVPTRASSCRLRRRSQGTHP